jgi:ABC-type transport system involved in cytochrome c biogenesis ATPase subunit
VREAFTRLLTADSPHRMLLISGPSGTGKSHLTRYLLGLALRCPWLACGRFDLKSGADLDGEFARFIFYLGVDEAARTTAGQGLRGRLDSILNALCAQGKPTLLII